MIENFVAGIDDGPQRDVQALAHTDRDEDFRIRIVLDLEGGLQVGADRLAELDQAEIGSVTGAPAFQREDGGFANMPRRDEPRLANAERHDIVHRLDDVEEITNPRARNTPHMLGDKIALRLTFKGHRFCILRGERRKCKRGWGGAVPSFEFRRLLTPWNLPSTRSITLLRSRFWKDINRQ